MFRTALWFATLAYLVAVALSGFLENANAVVTPNSFVTPQTPNVSTVQFIPASDGPSVPKTIYTGAASGSKCTALVENNSDQTQTHLMTFMVIHSAVTASFSTLTTSLSTGAATFGTGVDVFSTTNSPGLPRDGSGNPYIFLGSGDTLKAIYVSTITATDAIQLMAVCSDF